MVVLRADSMWQYVYAKAIALDVSIVQYDKPCRGPNIPVLLC